MWCLSSRSPWRSCSGPVDSPACFLPLDPHDAAPPGVPGRSRIVNLPGSTGGVKDAAGNPLAPGLQ